MPTRARRKRTLRLDVVTIFPDMFTGVLSCSILKRAQQQQCVTVHVHDLRDYTHDKHRTVDDRPYGGGPGMVFQPAPVFEAVEAVQRATRRYAKRRRVVLLSPQGERFTQAHAADLSRYRQLILICAHYEGIDERVREVLVDQEISIGDYVLTGGELPAMVLIDAVTRLLPGVLGHQESTVAESFQRGLLEYPQYTRPEDFRGHRVPEILLSGDHAAIADWRAAQSLTRTADRRPDLLASHEDTT